MQNKLISGFLLILSFCVFLFGCGQQTLTINDLLSHFKNSGLSVEEPPPLSEQERVVVEKARVALKKFGAGRKSTLLESKTMIIDSVKVKIRRYQNASYAQEKYKDYLKKQELRSQRKGNQIGSFYRSTYLLNGPFILDIRHYKIKSLKEFRLVPVDVPVDAIKRIEESFNNLGKHT